MSHEALGERRKRRFSFTRLAVLVALPLAAIGAAATLRVGPPPTISIEPELPAIGPRTPVTVRFE